MRKILQGAAWLLALLALLADSKGSRVNDQLSPYVAIRVDCETPTGEECPDFHIYSDYFAEIDGNRHYIYDTNPDRRHHMLIQVPDLDLSSYFEFLSTGIPSIWEYRSLSLVRQQVRTDSHVLTLEKIALNTVDTIPLCRTIVGESTASSTLIRNLVLLPGVLYYQSSLTLDLKFYDADGAEIPAAYNGSFWKFAKDRIPTRVTLPRMDALSICSGDLQDLEERIEIEMIDP